MSAHIISIGGRAPRIDDRAWVAPGARVLGAVTVEADSSIWYGAVLRAESAPITIGAGTNLQDNSVVHTDPGCPAVLGDNVSVGHAPVLHGCSVGDGCLISMAAVVMNGAVIGEGSLVAAGAVVPEGLQVPPGSLVIGVPAAAHRTLSDRELDAARKNANAYVDLARTHRQALLAEAAQ